MSSSTANQTSGQTGISQWQIDPVHSSIEFSVKHMMVATVKGSFQHVEGTIDFDPDQPEAAAVTAKIDTGTVSTGNEFRDNHLRTNDFFNAGEHQYIIFHSTSVEPTGHHHYKVQGDLTIRDVTRPVVLDAEFEGHIADGSGKERAGFSATTQISRKDFGINWNKAIEGGGVTVSDTVKIALNIAAVRTI
jgi:polyisoprenoid-binding protein YceI